jgi:hypothetical protein
MDSQLSSITRTFAIDSPKNQRSQPGREGSIIKFQNQSISSFDSSTQYSLWQCDYGSRVDWSWIPCKATTNAAEEVRLDSVLIENGWILRETYSDFTNRSQNVAPTSPLTTRNISYGSSKSSQAEERKKKRSPKKNLYYRTNLCRSFALNQTCVYGSKCMYAHGDEQLRPVPVILAEYHPDTNWTKKFKTAMCQSFQNTGYCPYGKRCQFAHGGDELRSKRRLRL